MTQFTHLKRKLLSKNGLKEGGAKAKKSIRNIVLVQMRNEYSSKLNYANRNRKESKFETFSVLEYRIC
jgi:hypothetical protein